MDTKANLMYKLDRKDEAIALEEKVLAIYKDQMNDTAINETAKTIGKMKRNEPTWPMPENAVQTTE